MAFSSIGMSDAKIQHWDGMYTKPLPDIPWEIKEPPKELVEFIAFSEVVGDKALDIGCGTGNYAFYLARHGFEVVGVDFSQKAIEIAEERNRSLALPVRFVCADVTKIAEALFGERFDFILDYSILHHLETSAIASYARACANLLKSGGKLLLVCYSGEDAKGDVSGTGKYGNTMFYRSADDIRALYAESGLREQSYQEARLGRRLHHAGHCFVFAKK